MISMCQSLYVEVFREAAGQRLLRLHNQGWIKNEPLLRLQEIPTHMSLESVVQYIFVELKGNKKNKAGLKDPYERKEDYNYGAGLAQYGVCIGVTYIYIYIYIRVLYRENVIQYTSYS